MPKVSGGFFSRRRLKFLNNLGLDTHIGTIKKNADSVSRRSFKHLGTTKLRILTYLSTFVFSVMVIGLVGVIFVFAYFSRDLPNPNTLLERSLELSTRFYDRNDNLIYEVYGDKNRTLVTMQSIPTDMQHATLATEDASFYTHQGYSIVGMARAAKNIFFGGSLQSGSTLTQQVIKNTLLSQEQTVTRKIKELILSLQLESRYSKDQILQMYLNETPYGGQNYGVYSAAKAYFNKVPADLTLAEAAYLAGLPQSPSYYSQFGSNPEAGLARKDYVLYLMHDHGWLGPDGKRFFISDDAYNKAKEEKLNFQTERVPLAAPHFIYYAKQYAADLLGSDVVEKGGLKIKTTLDMTAQNLAQDTITNELTKSSQSLNIWNASMVVINPQNGEILAMVGSKGYNLDPQPAGCVSGTTGDNSCTFDPYVNVAISKRQPGSAIKPITYATMLSQGYTAAYPFLDVPIAFEGAAPDQPYIPENYEGTYQGVMSLRKSLGNSENIPAVEALKIAGISNMIAQAQKMGITTFTDPSRYGLALTLGGGETKLLELTNAYSVFADKGLYHPPTPIIEIDDPSGKVIYKPQAQGVKALDEGVAFIISDVLSDDGARSAVFGVGSLLNISGRQVAVKTGTTDDKRDNYAIGYTPSVVVGVWVGNSNNDKMNPYVASGISGASPIWNTFMKTYLADKPVEKFDPPADVQKITVDTLTGGLPYEDFPTRPEWFVKGTEPTAKSDWYQKLEVCKIDGRLANQGCKDADETSVKNFVKITAPYTEWQSAADSWVKENYKDDTKYFPPQMTSQLEFDGSDVTNQDNVGVKIVGVNDNDKVSLKFRLNIEVSAYNKLKQVRIYMDGKKIADDSSAPYGYSFDLSAGDIGTHEFEATAEDKSGNKGSDTVKLQVVGYSAQ